jgi:hypothetical protein
MKCVSFLTLFCSILIIAVKSNSIPYVGNPVVETCVGCKFIWENIEESLTNSGSFLDKNDRRNPILAAQAFQYFCRIAPDIFFEPCNQMFEKLYFLTQDFCARKPVVNICLDNGFCVKK